MDGNKQVRCLNRSMIAEKAFKAKMPTSNDEYICYERPSLAKQHTFGSNINPIFNVALDINTKLNPPCENGQNECVKGYPNQPINIFYQTSSSTYGSRAPTYHTAPIAFHPKDGEFTKNAVTTKSRSALLNTALDKTII